MNNVMIKPLIWVMALGSAATLTGCGDAETTINEKASVVIEDDHDHDHGNGSTAGRLAIIDSDALNAHIYNLADNDLLSTVTLPSKPSAVYATGGYRYAALIERNADTVSFIDGGLWQEPHEDHFDTYSIMPSLTSVSLSGSRPTHFVTHDGQTAIFYDGDAASGNSASVQIFDDELIENQSMPMQLNLTMAQHGVAEPRGEYLLSTIRRDDSESTSANKVLPDQVGVYHLRDGNYELDIAFDTYCPDLHGAAQNETHIIFGCSDGVLVVADNGDGNFTATKLANNQQIAEGLRIGTLWGHHESTQFIGQASQHGGSDVQFFVIDPTNASMTLVDWQPKANAMPVARGFSFEAEKFLILDNQGYLTVIEPHVDGGNTHWEFGEQLAITQADVTTMPAGKKFLMAIDESAHKAYVSDPIEQHIVVIDLEILTETAHIELDFSPSMMVWLGLAASH